MSDFIVTKPFLRGGHRLRRGDPLPSGVDAPTLADYKRLGMIAPAETKPASPARSSRQLKEKPTETKPAAPAETLQVQLAADSSQLSATSSEGSGAGAELPAGGEGAQSVTTSGK